MPFILLRNVAIALHINDGAITPKAVLGTALGGRTLWAALDFNSGAPAPGKGIQRQGNDTDDDRPKNGRGKE